MRQKIYAVRDKLALSYIGGLQLFPHDAVAVRMFGDVAASKDSVIGAHVGDHELHCVGEFDQEIGVVWDTMAEVSETAPMPELAPIFFRRPRVVITGEAWLASQARGPERVSEAV